MRRMRHGSSGGGAPLTTLSEPSGSQRGSTSRETMWEVSARPPSSAYSSGDSSRVTERSLRSTRMTKGMAFAYALWGLNYIAHADHAVVQDVGAKAAPVDECLLHRSVGKRVVAGLAQPDTAHRHATHAEFLVD